MKDAKLCEVTVGIINNWMRLLGEVEEQIERVEKKLAERAKTDNEAKRLMTHRDRSTDKSLFDTHTW